MAKILKFLINVPNILCHIRVITSLLCYYYFFTHPIFAINCYILSVSLDNLDGEAARFFNQCSQFGACYDMIVDRMSTIIFMMNLSILLPHYTFWFALMSMLDFSSHWFQVYIGQLKGAKSHKAMIDHNLVVRIYYTNRFLRFMFSLGFEMFVIQLYISCFGPQSDLPVFSEQFMELNQRLFYFAIPNFMGRQIVNGFQLVTAALLVAEHDEQMLKQKLKQQ